MGEDFVDWPNRAGFGWVRRSCTGCSCGAVRCHAARRTSIGCRVFVGPVAFSSTDRLRTTGPTHLGPHPRTGHTAPAHSNTDFVPGWGSGYGERLEQVTGDGGDQLARVVDAAGVELVTGRGFVSLLEGVQVRTGVGDGESPAVMGTSDEFGFDGAGGGAMGEGHLEECRCAATVLRGDPPGWATAVRSRFVAPSVPPEARTLLSTTGNLDHGRRGLTGPQGGSPGVWGGRRTGDRR
jgi:hypothetical protein